MFQGLSLFSAFTLSIRNVSRKSQKKNLNSFNWQWVGMNDTRKFHFQIKPKETTELNLSYEKNSITQNQTECQDHVYDIMHRKQLRLLFH